MKRAAWALADLTFYAGVNITLALIDAWEKLMDLIWRLRCKLNRRRIRPH